MTPKWYATLHILEIHPPTKNGFLPQIIYETYAGHDENGRTDTTHGQCDYYMPPKVLRGPEKYGYQMRGYRTIDLQ